MYRYTLEELGLVDADPEPVFTHVAELASRLLGAPVSLVSFIQPERDRQYFKARVGTEDVQTPLSRSFCRQVVASDEPLAIEDSLEDYRVWDNPAIEENKVRAYLGMPVHDPNGRAVATLCVTDERPHVWTEDDKATLEALAGCVTNAIRLKFETHQSERLRREQHEFTHAISHDVKSPLQTLGWVLEDVEANHGESFTRDTAKLVELGHETIARTRAMVDDLLALASVEQSGDIDPAPVDLGEVLGEIVDSLSGDIARRDARVHVPEDLPTVHGDRRQIALLFRNLVGNALKFHRPGVAPRVRLSSRETDGAVELAVADNGTGIAPEHHERVFALFERLERGEDRDGSGVGLPLVARVVDNHGGEIRIESDGSTGTTFVVTLPRRTAAPVTAFPGAKAATVTTSKAA